MDYKNLPFHPTSEKIVQIISDKVQNNDLKLFRVIVAYYLGVVASNMRISITGFGRQEIPVNVYAIALSPSGTGKGFSTSIVERDVIQTFKDEFYSSTFNMCADHNLDRLASIRAARNGTDALTDEMPLLQKEYASLGSPLFVFDSASTAAIKQLRNKFLLAEVGALSLQIDEIGANLLNQTEALTSFLELYDKGFIKEKLLKSSAENIRYEKLEGSTPTNMLLVGTPSKIFDGAATETAFIEFLTMGYARRSIFAYTRHIPAKEELTPEEIVSKMFDSSSDMFIDTISMNIGKLADIDNVGKTVDLPKDVLLHLVTYKLDCERRASEFKAHQEVFKMEMLHRYFKVLKIAGAYAFIDGSPDITEDLLFNAIALVEESGNTSFTEMCEPERPYEKLANHLAEIGKEQTLPDLDNDLPYFKGSRATKDDMLNMAIAWGYSNNIIIKKTFRDGILFIEGETLGVTNLDEMIIATSDDITEGYEAVYVSWDELKVLGETPNVHWVNHHLVNGYRKETNAVPGFNMLVLDVDGTYPLEAAKTILQGYKALFYTTKSHTDKSPHYRIILPLNHILRMEREEYKQFMHNVYEFLPFKMDEQGDHRCKKWTSHDGEVHEIDGDLFDVTPFIPQTKKNENRIEQHKAYGNLDGLEYWFLNNTGAGNRNHQMHKYARVLVDKGYDYGVIQEKIMELNNKLPEKLSEEEIVTTVMQTVANAIHERDR